MVTIEENNTFADSSQLLRSVLLYTNLPKIVKGDIFHERYFRKCQKQR